MDKDNLIIEQLHSFATQYAVADEVADIVYIMIQKRIFYNEYHTSNNQDISCVQIDLTLGMYNNTQAYIKSFNAENKSLKIGIILPVNFSVQPKDKLIDNLRNAITHELMHGYIAIQRHLNNQEYNDAPLYYEKLISIMQDFDEGDLVRDAAVALYGAYYQETQAIISQTAIQVRNIIKQNNIVKPTNEQIKEIISFLDGYRVCQNILNKFLPYIEKINDDKLQKCIINVFNEYEINIETNSFKKECNRLNLYIKKWHIK